MPALIAEETVSLEFEDLYRRVLLPRIATPDGFLSLPERSKGIHISGILKPLGIACKELKPMEKLEEEYPLLWALGCAWEEYAASFYPEMVYQPGEMEIDGLYLNCDGISSDPELGAVVEEFKFTFKGEMVGDRDEANDRKMRWFLAEWMWMHQGRSYCKGWGANIVRWHVCHIRGDYRSFGPVYKKYTVEFSNKEIEQTWQMLVKNKSLAEHE